MIVRCKDSGTTTITWREKDPPIVEHTDYAYEYLLDRIEMLERELAEMRASRDNHDTGEG